MKAWSNPFVIRNSGPTWSMARRLGQRGRRRRFYTGAGVAGALALMGTLMATPAEATSGLENGSFESPVVTPGSFRRFSAGDSVGVWTVTSGTVDLSGAGLWETVDGVQSLELNGINQGAVAQRIPTFPLTRYKVSYSLAGETLGGPAVKTGQVLVNDQVAQTFSFDITGKSRPSMGYVKKGFTFLSTGTSATLRFASTVAGPYGPVIDDVKVESCLLIICLS